MLDEVIALCHEPLIGAFIANAHLPVSWQVSVLRSFQESIAVLITAEERILIAPVDVTDTVPLSLCFEPVEKERFVKEFALLPWDRRYFSIRTGRKKKDYMFSPEVRYTRRFPKNADYWEFLVNSRL